MENFKIKVIFLYFCTLYFILNNTCNIKKKSIRIYFIIFKFKLLNSVDVCKYSKYLINNNYNNNKNNYYNHIIKQYIGIYICFIIQNGQISKPKYITKFLTNKYELNL